MNAVGIDVSKGKSMMAALRPMGEVALHSHPLDRLDFCRCHFAAENGEQDLTNLPPAFVRSILTAKPSALVRRLSVGFAVALPPRPRPLPKNRIRANV